MTEEQEIIEEYKKDFPNIKEGEFIITSPQSEYYNCIAWAANDNKRWWWPDRFLQYYWPENFKREETLETFIKYFSSLGYIKSESGDLEDGYIKIAIYTKDGKTPEHATRQLPSGKWTSKMGPDHDVEHSLYILDGGRYGNVSLIMKKIHS